jgi:hypothetical protein
VYTIVMIQYSSTALICINHIHHSNWMILTMINIYTKNVLAPRFSLHRDGDGGNGGGSTGNHRAIWCGPLDVETWSGLAGLEAFWGHNKKGVWVNPLFGKLLNVNVNEWK